MPTIVKPQRLPCGQGVLQVGSGHIEGWIIVHSPLQCAVIWFRYRLVKQLVLDDDLDLFVDRGRLIPPMDAQLRAVIYSPIYCRAAPKIAAQRVRRRSCLH
ncbi:hypothetical protein D3C84_1034530 [compost metagenome]